MSHQPPPAGGPAVAPRQRSARRQFASTILVLEAFVVVFAALVAYGVRAAPSELVWGVGGSLTLALILVSGMLRWPAGYLGGSALQLAVLACGVVVPMMFGVGGVFVLMWVVALRLGGRIDRERAERSAREDSAVLPGG